MSAVTLFAVILISIKSKVFMFVNHTGNLTTTTAQPNTAQPTTSDSTSNPTTFEPTIDPTFNPTGIPSSDPITSIPSLDSTQSPIAVTTSEPSAVPTAGTSFMLFDFDQRKKSRLKLKRSSFCFTMTRADIHI